MTKVILCHLHVGWPSGKYRTSGIFPPPSQASCGRGGGHAMTGKQGSHNACLAAFLRHCATSLPHQSVSHLRCSLSSKPPSLDQLPKSQIVPGKMGSIVTLSLCVCNFGYSDLIQLTAMLSALTSTDEKVNMVSHFYQFEKRLPK